jgi:hypothetical protein
LTGFAQYVLRVVADLDRILIRIKGNAFCSVVER